MITPGDVAQLGSAGFFTRASFLGGDRALRVLAEARRLPLKRAGIGRGHEFNDGVRTDERTWLTREETSGALAEAVTAFESLMASLNEAAWQGLRSFDLQLAHYPPGARYARHRDAFVGQDNRRITAIVYLNPDWEPAHGGVLRVHAEPPRDLEPTLDRLVVFRSEQLEHEVLEARADRWALTAWYSARG